MSIEDRLAEIIALLQSQIDKNAASILATQMLLLENQILDVQELDSRIDAIHEEIKKGNTCPSYQHSKKQTLTSTD